MRGRSDDLHRCTCGHVRRSHAYGMDACHRVDRETRKRCGCAKFDRIEPVTVASAIAAEKANKARVAAVHRAARQAISEHVAVSAGTTLNGEGRRIKAYRIMVGGLGVGKPFYSRGWAEENAWLIRERVRAGETPEQAVAHVLG